MNWSYLIGNETAKRGGIPLHNSVLYRGKQGKYLLIPLAALLIAAGIFLSAGGQSAADTDIGYDYDTFAFIGKIAEKVSPAVVSVRSISSGGGQEGEDLLLGTGSGVIFSADGYLITNYHVISGADKVLISLADGREAVADIIASYAESDLALLSIDLESLPLATLGDSDQVQVGNIVFAIGNPGGEQFARSLTMGVVSGLERDLRLSDGYGYKLLQTDAAINPGNSGGPLVDCYGRVIGINSIKIVDADFEGMGFAIPINTVRDVISQDMPEVFSRAVFAAN